MAPLTSSVGRIDVYTYSDAQVGPAGVGYQSDEVHGYGGDHLDRLSCLPST